MTVILLVIALVCALLAYLLIEEGKKNTSLLVENNQLKGRMESMKEAADKAASEKSSDVAENAESAAKPLSVQSIRTALRFNGYSPEIVDTHEPDIINFKQDNTRIRIDAAHLPYLSISAGFTLNEPKENLTLLQNAADEVVSRMFVGKAYLVDDGAAVIFSAEFIADYVYLRNNLKEYVRIMMETGRHFYETYNQLKGQQKKDQEAVFSGESFIQNSQLKSKKVQS